MSTAILQQTATVHAFADRSRIRAWADRLYSEGVEAGKRATEWDRMPALEREELIAEGLKRVLPTIKVGPVTLQAIYQVYTEAPALFMESFGAGFSEGAA